MTTAGHPAHPTGGAPHPTAAPVAETANPAAEEAAHAAELDSWLNAQVQVLKRAYENLETSDFRGGALRDFLEVAHDMVDQASMLGFPLAGNVADCLCHLIDGTPDAARLPRTLVRQHVDAIRAIVAEGASGDSNAVANMLVARLRDVTDDFIATHCSEASAA